jgi:hypothetical protein
VTNTIRGLLVLLCLTAVHAHAQSCSVAAASGTCTTPISLSSPATLTNPRIVRLSATPATTSITATIDDYDRTPTGFVAFIGPTFTVSANRTWSMSVNATTASWAAAGALARTSKPVSDLTWSTSSGGSHIAMSTSPATLGSGGATSATATTLFFHMALDWTADTPGSYTIVVQVTIATP